MRNNLLIKAVLVAATLGVAPAALPALQGRASRAHARWSRVKGPCQSMSRTFCGKSRLTPSAFRIVLINYVRA